MQTITSSKLEPIVTPEPVLFWPPQPGWYVIGFIFLLLVVFGIYKWLQHKERNSYRQRAIIELNKLLEYKGKEKQITHLNKLLKAIALAGFSRDQVAQLQGVAWVEFLERTCPKVKFTLAPGTLLLNLQYKQFSEKEISKQDWHLLIEMSKEWAKHHNSKLV